MEPYFLVTKITLVFCDYVNIVYLFVNVHEHQHPKYIEMDIHFVREKVTCGQVCVLHIPSRQIIDIFTKDLLRQLFDDCRLSLSVWQPPILTNFYIQYIFIYVYLANQSHLFTFFKMTTKLRFSGLCYLGLLHVWVDWAIPRGAVLKTEVHVVNNFVLYYPFIIKRFKQYRELIKK